MHDFSCGCKCGFYKYVGPLSVGPKSTLPASHMQQTMRIARRCTALLLPRALPLGQTDGRKDGHGSVEHVEHVSTPRRRLDLIKCL